MRVVPLTVKINLGFWMLYGFGHQSLTNKFLHLIVLPNPMLFKLILSFVFFLLISQIHI